MTQNIGTFGFWQLKHSLIPFMSGMQVPPCIAKNPKGVFYHTKTSSKITQLTGQIWLNQMRDPLVRLSRAWIIIIITYYTKLSRYSRKDLLYCPCSHSKVTRGDAGNSLTLTRPAHDWCAVTMLRIFHISVMRILRRKPIHNSMFFSYSWCVQLG